MKKTFTKYFVPHPSNDHQPHLLRTRGILACLAVVLLIELVFLVQILVVFPNANFLATIVATVLVDKTNTSRTDAELPPLAVSHTLEQAAALKANDMAVKGYFAHVSPDGASPWIWFEKAGYLYEYAGENLAINFTDSEDAVRAWLNSPSHRANIMNGHFSETGIGTASGKYQGRDTVFIVQLFGKPSIAAAAAVPTTEAAPSPVPSPRVVTPTPAKPTTVPAVAPTPSPVVGTKIETKAPAPIPAIPIATDVERNVLGEADVLTTSAPFWESWLASPRRPANILFVILATLVAIALVFKIFVRVEVAHPHLVLNGVLFLLIVSSVLILNQYLTTRGAIIF